MLLRLISTSSWSDGKKKQVQDYERVDDETLSYLSALTHHNVGQWKLELAWALRMDRKDMAADDIDLARGVVLRGSQVQAEDWSRYRTVSLRIMQLMRDAFRGIAIRRSISRSVDYEGNRISELKPIIERDLILSMNALDESFMKALAQTVTEKQAVKVQSDFGSKISKVRFAAEFTSAIRTRTVLRRHTALALGARVRRSGSPS